MRTSHALAPLLTAFFVVAAQAQFETALSASEPNPFWFGQRVAISGDYVVIGEPGGVVGGKLAGAAYIFERAGGTWRYCQKLWTERSGGVLLNHHSILEFLSF